jgi:peptidoglycan glycosyltransferase
VNKPLRRIAVAVMAMFAAMLVNINYIHMVQAEDLRTERGNSRLLLEEYSRERGPIVVAGTDVARSVETNGALRFLREYTAGPLYAAATGYYSSVYGATGVERAENAILGGTDDRLFVRRILDTLTGEANRGGSVALTLDPAAQQAAVEGLGDRPGAVVALEPDTGKILAIASSPTYDPGVLSNPDATAVTQAFEALDADPARPLLNRAISEIYPPGSTFKIVTTAAALESGRWTPDSEVFGGAVLDLQQSTATLPNASGAPCTGGETTTLLEALKRSCNTAFGRLGVDLGADTLLAQAEAFGFGERFEMPMTTATSRFPADANSPQIAQSAIGQFDVAATPLQMAMVAAGVANRGIVMAPYLVDEVRGPDTVSLGVTDPRELSRAVSPQTADTLTAMMVAVVEDGTGTNAAIDGVRVAGKTGTAQQGGDRPPHAWFVSFAPADDPQVAVAVIIESGGGEAEISGNRLAAPVARQVMAAVLAQ